MEGNCRTNGACLAATGAGESWGAYRLHSFDKLGDSDRLSSAVEHMW